MHSTLQTILQDLEAYCETQQWEAIISTCECLMIYASKQLPASSSLGKNPVGESEMYRVKGHFLETKEDIAGAINAYQQAIALNPLTDAIYLKLANLYRQQEQWENVANAYQRSLQANPNQPDVAQQLLKLLDHSTHLSLSVELDLLDKILSNYPDMINADCHFILGNLLSKEGKIDAAIRCYQVAIAQDPEQADYHSQLANGLSQIKEYSTAIDAYYQALKLSPESDTIHYKIGCCLQKKSEFETACSHFQSAIELNPKSASSYVELGKIWYQEGLTEKAINAYINALILDPELTEPYIKLRYNLLRYDIYPSSPLLEDVCQKCRSILDKYPNLLPIQSLLGYALTRKKDCESAAQYYQKASEKKAHLFCKNITEKQWKTAQSKTPSFIIIGAFKCATTSLYQYINRHPNVLPSLEKELDFFDLQFDNGLDWYQSHFPPVPTQGVFITGEATPNYFYGLKTPERIAQNLPDVKLILILRNPISRTVSHYNFLQRNRQDAKPIEDILELELERLSSHASEDKPNWKLFNQNCYIGHSLYFFYLRRWLNFINREQLLVINHEELKCAPQSILSQTFEYLELPDYQLSEYQKYKVGNYSPISSEMHQKLCEFFTPHVHALEDLIDMKFGWDLS